MARVRRAPPDGRKKKTRRSERPHWQPGDRWSRYSFPEATRQPTTPFDILCQRINRPRVNAEIYDLLGGRAKDITIRQWRYGTRRPAQWAIDIIEGELKRRAGGDLDAISTTKKKRAAPSGPYVWKSGLPPE